MAKGKPPKKKNRLERLVDLQEKAVKDWGKYTESTAKLFAQGKMSPGTWMKEYTNMSKSVVQNFGELMRIISGGPAR